ncbi:MAG: SGNH/GDSL hydrolase family protein, partial [Roseobacter sp.]
MKRALRLALFAGFAAVAPTFAVAQSTPDILVLGDSQISFGAGEVYLNYFDELPDRCKMTSSRKRRLAKLGDRQTAAIGVRS